jgi:hypothetical protein
MQIPRYKHDCDACKFIGNHLQYDVYHCSGILGGSVIARFGNKGSEYASAPLEIAKQVHSEHILHQAYLMFQRGERE